MARKTYPLDKVDGLLERAPVVSLTTASAGKPNGRRNPEKGRRVPAQFVLRR
jgi:hypothetical protein